MTPEFAQTVLAGLWETDTVGAVALEQLRLQSFQDCQAAEILAKWFGIIVTSEVLQKEFVHDPLQVAYEALFGTYDGTIDGEG